MRWGVVAGIFAPADGSFPGMGQKPIPRSPLSTEYAPFVERARDRTPVGRAAGGGVSPASPPVFLYGASDRPRGLHEDLHRAMVTQSTALSPQIESKMRLLIVEDDRESADYLVKAFREVGHIADLAGDGEEGLVLAETGDYDVLVIDRMLPKRDGLSIIGTLRGKGNHTPALILSALGQVDDRIKGLRAGGDDYLPKPYSFAELLARVEVLSRRKGGPSEDTTYRVGDLELDRLVASCGARDVRDHAAAARIPAAGIFDEACRAGGHAHHAA